MKRFTQQRLERKGSKGLESYAPCSKVCAAKRRKPIWIGYFKLLKSTSRNQKKEWSLRWRPAREADLGEMWRPKKKLDTLHSQF